MKKRILALFIALTLVATLCPVTILAASELPPITYIDAAGQEQTRSGYKAITSTSPASWEEWCVVNSDVTISSRITCNGNVKLILADGVTLTAEKGITVSGSGNSLTIYGQENGTGKLIATGASDNAGIGGINGQDGGNITIYCGDITAQGGFMGAGIGGGHNGIAENITIAGGKVTAIGGRYAAGIGGGYANESGKKVSNITISGGVVNASSTNEQGDLCGGAGIGGGSNEDADKITISGGDVTATGGLFSAGIGGGCVGIAENITISGGKVTAIGGRYGAGIGGGYTNNSGKKVSNITISGGVVNASCTYFNEDQCGGAGIGGGNGEHADKITISGGKVTAASGKYGAGIGGGCGKDGTNIKFTGGTVTATAVHQGAGIGGGYNGKGSNINFTGGIVTATGCSDTSAVGNGYGCTSSSNIYATSSVVVNVGTSNPPNDTLTHTSEQDITSGLAGKQFASFKGTHTFSFNMQGHGTQVEAQTKSAGSKADKPADPSATGYSFQGWYKEAACENKWDFSTDTVDADTEVFAGWKAKTAAITIDANGGTSGARTVVTGTYDSAMPILSSGDLPSYEGYTFAGFFDLIIGGKKYYNADGTSAANWDKDSATETLYARWTPSTDTPYTVEHYQQNVADSGYTLKDTDHDSGTTGELTEASAKTTYEGFTAQTFSQETISAKGTTNVSIYYNRSIYTINFIVDGEITSDQYCKYGEFVAEPKAPEKEGYNFVGWFKESTCENEWDFSTDTTPASNTNLYADFEKSDETLFNEYKEAQKKELDKLGTDYGDVVKNAKEALDDLSFNSNKTLAENKALVDAVVSPVSKDLEDSRKSYAPKLVSGDKQSLDLNTATSASFKSEAPFDEFIKVTVNNKDVHKKYYSATEGSTIITLNNDFLGTLDTGEHTISIVSTNGHADGTFTITAQYTPPATGDAAPMILWVFFLAISMLGVFAFVFSRKNRL